MFSHGFYGSGIREGLSWAVLLGASGVLALGKGPELDSGRRAGVRGPLHVVVYHGLVWASSHYGGLRLVRRGSVGLQA